MEIINKVTETNTFALMTNIITFAIVLFLIIIYYAWTIYEFKQPKENESRFFHSPINNFIFLGVIAFTIILPFYAFENVFVNYDKEKIQVQGESTLDKYNKSGNVVYAHLKDKDNHKMKIKLSENEWINQKDSIHRGDTVKLSPDSKEQLEHGMGTSIESKDNHEYELTKDSHLEKVNK